MPFENFYRPEKFSMFTDILNDYRAQKKMAADRAFEEKKLEQSGILNKAKANQANMMSTLIQQALGLPGQGTQQAESQPAPQMPQSTPSSRPPLGANIAENLPPEQQAKVESMQPGEAIPVPSHEPNPNASQMSRKQLVERANQDTANNQPVANSRSGFPMTPESIKARNILIALGKLKETPEEQEARETRTSANTEWTKNDIKRIEDWNKTIDANRQIEPNLQLMEDKLATPEAQQLFSHPEYFGWDIAYAKRFGKPEDIDIITTMNTAGKDLFTTVGSQFKGPFRKFEFNLLTEAFPTQNDTFAQKYAKLTTLKAMKSVVTETLSTASDMVRNSGGQISPNQALEIAMKENKIEERMKQVKNEFETKMKDATFKKKEFEKNHEKQMPQPPPIFTSREEFSNWFNRQSPDIKKAYRKQIAEGGT